MNTKRENKGFVLTAVMMMLLITALVGSAFLFSARNSFATVDRWRQYDECLLGLQSGLEQAEYALDSAFRINAQTNASITSLNTLANKNTTGNFYWTNTLCGQTYVVTVTVSTVSSSASIITPLYKGEVTLTNTASASYGGVKRCVKEIVRYVYDSAVSSGSSVFDNAFYIDHQGIFNGVNGVFNGDVRTSGDIDFQNCSSLYFNGDVYAGGLIYNDRSGTYGWNGTGSRAYNDTSARPMLWTDKNTNNASTYWPQGYAGTVTRYNAQVPPDLPYIGPLSEYESYAVASTGTLWMGTTTVSAVWGDTTNENSRLGITNGTDIGCLVITNGAQINGVVVARGDVYIKGRIAGQGTIYAGRNIYVLNNLTYSNAPSWPKPDSNPSNTAAINQTKDFVGLCAKGNLIIGSDFSSFLKEFAKSPLTSSHASDAMDASLGYVSYISNGVSMFNGNYTAVDGQNHNSVRSDGSARSYYEPILSDSLFNSLGVSASVGHIDGVLYANHMIAGTVNGLTINGSMVCRDEVLNRQGNLNFNWDIRVGSQSKERLGYNSKLPDMLPRQANKYRIITWTEEPAP